MASFGERTLDRIAEKREERAEAIGALIRLGEMGTVPNVGNAAQKERMQAFEIFMGNLSKNPVQAYKLGGRGGARGMANAALDWVHGYQEFLGGKTVPWFMGKRNIMKELDGMEAELDGIIKAGRKHEVPYEAVRGMAEHARAIKHELRMHGMGLRENWETGRKVSEKGASAGRLFAELGDILGTATNGLPSPLDNLFDLAPAIQYVAHGIRRAVTGMRNEIRRLDAETGDENTLIISGANCSQRIARGMETILGKKA